MARHLQCDTEAQDIEDKPLRNEDFRCLGEVLLFSEISENQKQRGATRPLLAWAVAGNCEVPLEGRAVWNMAAAILHDDVFLIPKNVKSERSIALLNLDSLVGVTACT